MFHSSSTSFFVFYSFHDILEEIIIQEVQQRLKIKKFCRWSESVKLVVWSGATWLVEVVSWSLTSLFYYIPSEHWYDYLWYLPASINGLRGVGIFFILVMTPENRIKLRRVVRKVGWSRKSFGMTKNSRSMDGNSSTSGHHQSSVSGGSGGSEGRILGRRNMSVATTVTTLSQLSSIRSSQSTDSRPDAGGGNGRGSSTQHPRLAHSVSQLDSRRSSMSSASSADCEGFELDAEAGAGGRRKSSLANFGVVSLPSVDEEDALEVSTPMQHPPVQLTKSASDA